MMGWSGATRSVRLLAESIAHGRFLLEGATANIEQRSRRGAEHGVDKETR